MREVYPFWQVVLATPLKRPAQNVEEKPPGGRLAGVASALSRGDVQVAIPAGRLQVLRRLGDVAHWIARAEVGDTGVGERAEHEWAAVGGKRQHVSNHPAVGETLGRIAEASTNVS